MRTLTINRINQSNIKHMHSGPNKASEINSLKINKSVVEFF